jgi:MOSC domain-containing protein YiiM
MRGTLVSINVSPGGVPKLPVPEALITATGVAGDRQKDLKWHGGPDRAVSLLALAVIRELQAAGHPIAPGSTGENLTIDGFAAEDLRPGLRLRIGAGEGATELELTTWLAPCGKIGGSFLGRRYSTLDDKHHPCRSRIGARVLVEGLVRAGDPIQVIG